MNKNYDLIIIGAGPSGLTAAIYAARYNLKTLVIGENIGGLASEAFEIENYPGFKLISGQELIKKFKNQVESLGIKVLNSTVVSIKKKNDLFTIQTSENKKYKAKTIILALGTEKRKLNIPEEEKFIGKGVSYCATCDAAFFKNKIVGVVGGRNSAVVSSFLLANYAKKVYIIYRRDKLRADPALTKRAEKNPKIAIIYKSIPKQLEGNQILKAVILDKEGKREELKLDGLFVEIGSIPSTDLVKQTNINLDKEGYIKINKDMSTNIKGIFAAGDITNGSNEFRQIITAAAEGAIAANSVYKEVEKLK